jgi:hypothetical protein
MIRTSIAISLLCLFLFSCTNHKQSEAEKILAEWTNKTVNFPDGISCSYMGRDTVCPDAAATPYKILLYTDSTGCTSCKLKSIILRQMRMQLKKSSEDTILSQMRTFFLRLKLYFCSINF